MAHFAQLDSSSIVKRILTLNNNVITDSDGNEQEVLGINFLQNLHSINDTLVQCSYNNNFRKQYAGEGYTYDKANDVFISPKPYASWTLDASFDWQPPTAIPDDGKKYNWNEATTAWDEV
jgi:hypothetical protein